MYNNISQRLLKLINVIVALGFSSLSLLWLAIKISTSYDINPELSFLSLLDLLRSQVSLDIALSVLFILNALGKAEKLSSIISFLLFIITSFYFLKLTGLYAYTYDSTPWHMITYGSYLLQLPLASEALSYLGYIVIPVTLFLILLVLVCLKLSNIWPAIIVFFLSLASAVPPVQRQIPVSIAYHPYIYSISGAFTFETPVSNHPDSFSLNNLEHTEIQKIQPRKNIVLVILESFFYDAISEATTPTLFAIQQHSINFTQAYATIPHTSKALVNIHCTQPSAFTPYLWESVYGSSEPCLPQLFDVTSVFFQGITDSFENRSSLIGTLGYKEFYSLTDMDTQGYQAVNYFSYEDNIMLPTSQKWLENNTANRFLASYLTGTSHHNYQTPSTFKQQNFDENPKLNRYMNSLAYVDHFVENLLIQYQHLDQYENSVFIFIGDHGEGFDKRKPLMHNNNLFQSGLHIPFFIFEPTNTHEAQSINDLVVQNDLSSLLISIMQNQPLKSERKYSTHSCWYMDYCYALLTVHEQHMFKLILDKRNHTDLLYNLSQDPLELNNLAQQEIELLNSLKQVLLNKIALNKHTTHHFLFSQDQAYSSKRHTTFTKFTAVDY